MLNVYLNKLNSLLDKTPELAMVLFSPALQTQVLSIAQNCIQRIPDGNATILETLRELTRSIMKELEQSVSILSFDPQRMGSYEGLLNMVISSMSFLMNLMSCAPTEYAMGIINCVCCVCRENESMEDVYSLSNLFFLIYLVFSSAIHIRRTIMQEKVRPLQRFRERSIQVEEVSAVISSILSKQKNQMVIAMFVNFLGDMMYLFSRNWKELYRTNEILMNGNVYTSTSMKDKRLMSPYGDNMGNTILYLSNFCSFAHFRRLFKFLFFITKYNNYRNPDSYQGAVEFVSIAVFERLFGIAYLQHTTAKEKKEIDWMHLIELPESCNVDANDSSSVVELIYSTAEMIKASGKTEYYKNIGKTKLVFIMVGFFWKKRWRVVFVDVRFPAANGIGNELELASSEKRGMNHF